MLLKALQAHFPTLRPLSKSLYSDEKSLGWIEKIGYAMGEGGGNIVFQMVSIYYLFYLTDVVQISAAAAGTLMVIARLLDGVNDPVTGIFLDKIKLPHQLGRIKGWILLATPLLLVNFSLLFAVPAWSQANQLIWIYATYLCFSVVFDLVITPYGSLMSVMTDQREVRTEISAIRSIFSGGAILLVTAGVVKLVDFFQAPRIGWWGTATLLGLFAAVGLLTTYFTAQERILPINGERKYNLADLRAIVLTNRPLITLFLFLLFSTAARTIINTANIYYFTYNAGNAGLLVQASFFSASALLSFMITPYLSRQMGQMKTILVGVSIATAGAIWRYFVDPTDTLQVMLTYLLFSIGTGFPWVLGYTMLTEVIDYTERETGFRAENIINSAYSFVYKLSQGAGAAVPAYLLASTGYSGAQTMQSEETLRAILLTVSLIPAALTLLGGLALIQYNLDE